MHKQTTATLMSMLLLGATFISNSDKNSLNTSFGEQKTPDLVTDKHGQGCCCSGCKPSTHK